MKAFNIIRKYFILFLEDSEPISAYGLLEQFTEVHVVDAIANSETENTNVDHEATNLLTKVLSYFTEKKDHSYPDNAANRALLQNFCKKDMFMHVFRVYPLPKFQSFDESNVHDLILRCPSHVLIPRNYLPKGVQSNGIICKSCFLLILFLFLLIARMNFLQSFIPLE